MQYYHEDIPDNNKLTIILQSPPHGVTDPPTPIRDELRALQEILKDEVDGLSCLVLHLEVAHQMHHVLQQGERVSHLGTVLYQLLYLRDRVLRGKTVHQHTDRLEELRLI
jgi:hypothetical protein